MKKRITAFILCAIMLITALPMCASAANEKIIAITFDDGPSATGTTTTLLDGLKERGVVATFFMNGANGKHGAVNHPDLLKRMVNEGHQLANHTYSHAQFGKLGAKEVRTEVEKVNSLLYKAMGGEYKTMVRTPGGAYNSTIANNVVALYPIFFATAIQWNSFPKMGPYTSASIFSTNNIRQFTQSGLLYIKNRDASMLDKFRAFGFTLLWYHIGAIYCIIATLNFSYQGAWLCVIPAIITLVMELRFEKSLRENQ